MLDFTVAEKAHPFSFIWDNDGKIGNIVCETGVVLVHLLN